MRGQTAALGFILYISLGLPNFLRLLCKNHNFDLLLKRITCSKVDVYLSGISQVRTFITMISKRIFVNVNEARFFVYRVPHVPVQTVFRATLR